jgi:hypothetical protein
MKRRSLQSQIYDLRAELGKADIRVKQLDAKNAALSKHYKALVSVYEKLSGKKWDPYAAPSSPPPPEYDPAKEIPNVHPLWMTSPVIKSPKLLNKRVAKNVRHPSTSRPEAKANVVKDKNQE